jgi:hypothetical protein
MSAERKHVIFKRSINATLFMKATPSIPVFPGRLQPNPESRAGKCLFSRGVFSTWTPNLEHLHLDSGFCQGSPGKTPDHLSKSNQKKFLTFTPRWLFVM